MATVARTPDVELLRRLRARDRTAWDELYLEFQPRLRAFAYRLSGNVHDADDLVQETFVRAVPRLDRLDPETTDVAAYLFATLKNLFLKQVERGKRQEPMADVPEPSVAGPIEDDPERSLLLQSQQDEVRVANAHLQPRQRLVLALRELEDRSYAEIGELVGMKENAVAQLIFRARESLRTELRLAQVDPESLPEECRRFLPLLAAHLDGQLKGARREETLAHLESCERCQAALADMREASRRYRTLFPLAFGAEEARAATAGTGTGADATSSPDATRDGVERRLEAAGYWRSSAAGYRARRLRRAGALLAAAVVLAAGGTALGVALADDDGVEALPATTAEPAPVATPGEPGVTAAPVTTEPQSVAATTNAPPPVPPASPAQPPPTEPKVTTTSTTEPEPAPETSQPETSQPETSQTEPDPKPKPPADTRAPVVRITAAPAAATSTATARIAFGADEQGVAFACSLDGAAFAACTSPVTLSALAPGAHTFSVRGTDTAGNVGKPVATAWTYTVPDTTPPSVSITAAPGSSTVSTTATFAFASNEAGVTFACSLDGGAFASCASPVSYGPLALGRHDFVVRATDAAGNVGPSDDHQWTIVQPLPDLVVSAFTANAITIRNQGDAPAGASVLTITLVGTFQVPALQPGASITFRWSTCRRGTYSVIVDRTNAVAESNEQNNTATRQSTCVT